MTNKAYFTLEIGTDELIRLVQSNLKTPSADKVAEVIVNCLAQSETGLTHVYKALNGIFPETKIKVGEIYYVDVAYLPNWRFDREATLALPGTKDDTLIPVRVESIDLYRLTPYEIRFKHVSKQDMKEVFDLYHIDEKHLKYKCEDVIDLLENIYDKQEDEPIF